MKIQIDTEDIVKNLDVEQMIKEHVENSDEICEIIDCVLNSTNVRKLVCEKTNEILADFLTTDEWKEFVIDTFKKEIGNLNLAESDEVKEMLSEIVLERLKDLR
jgi:hypothetical protein